MDKVLMFDKSRLKDYREKNLGWNQQDAAEKLGIRRQTLASWEKGGYTPSISQINLISRVYGVSGSFFLVEI